MIAVVMTPGEPLPHVVRWTGRKGLKAAAVTYCNKEYNAGEGVGQVPDNVRICEACDVAIQKLERQAEEVKR